MKGAGQDSVVTEQRSELTAARPTDRRSISRTGSLRVADAGGCRIHLGLLPDYLATMDTLVRQRRKTLILNHNLHSLYCFFTDERLSRIYARALVMVDGTGILLLLRAHGHAVRFAHRMAWLDFIGPLLDHAQRQGLRIFWLGNTAEVNARGLRVLRDRFPRLAIDGHHGFFDRTPGGAENTAVVEAINRFGADVVIVGMGTPVQEYWMDENQAAVGAPVMFSAGACLDYIAGHARTPPRWLGPIGLEWAYRLMSDPRRFAFRYLVEPWRVLVEVARNHVVRPGSTPPRLRDW